MTTKQMNGQFYTVNSDYILDGLSIPSGHVIEPFAGKGDLLTWLSTKGTYSVEAYDIDPKGTEGTEGTEGPNILQRDTLLYPLDYTGAWVLTNPPYLARNKSNKKELYDLYDTNDLYKCFLLSLVRKPCLGGILIIPAGFFLSSRHIDVRCRNAFLSMYTLLTVRYFEETVFPDTTTTVVAFSFVASASATTEQNVDWISLPSGQRRRFTMRAADDWIIGGDIYRLQGSGRIRRYVEGQSMKEGEQLTSMTLTALDSGTAAGRIRMEYKEGYVYPAKESSRTFATLCSERLLSADEQRTICSRFNALLEKKREETWSLFLPQYRESKEYARKRIPFELAYTIIRHVIHGL